MGTKNITTTTTPESSTSTTIGSTTTNLTSSAPSTTTVRNETTSTITNATSPDVTSTRGQETGGPESSNAGPIAGGILGGIVVVAIIIIVIVVIKRRKRQQPRCNLSKLPGKEDLEMPSEPHEKPYANITATGDTDELTDPSVGNDGYLKKTIHYVKAAKNPKANGTASGGDSCAADDMPLYGNEDFPPKTPRVNSMPAHDAPEPPAADKVGYSIGRVRDLKLEDNATVYTNAKVVDNAEPCLYVDMINDQHGEFKSAGAHSDKTHDKLYVNESALDSSNNETESTKLYENIERRNYRNVPNDYDSNKVNSDLKNAPNIPYANVGTVTSDDFVQDDVYEIP